MTDKRVPVLDDRESVFFAVRTAFEHPNILPAEISSELGVEAQRSWRRGDLRANPRGKPLPGGGNHAYSYWGRIFYYRTYDIAGRFDEFVDKVHDHKRFVTRLIKDGGRVKIILTLAGSLHAGFMFHGSTLDKISELGIEIGVEVFPDMETEQIDTDSF